MITPAVACSGTRDPDGPVVEVRKTGAFRAAWRSAPGSADGSKHMEAQRHIRWQADEAERSAGVTWNRFRSGRHNDAADRDPLVAKAVVQASRGSTDALRFLYAR